MSALRLAMLATFLTFGVAATAQAEVVNILDLSREPPNTPQGVQRPVKGMSMQQVEAGFGAPLERMEPVGDPPITRWVYDRYTVYFEYRHVIHAVVHP